jgi:hypothetical protein
MKIFNAFRLLSFKRKQILISINILITKIYLIYTRAMSTAKVPEGLHGQALIEFIEDHPDVNGVTVFRNYPSTTPYKFSYRMPNPQVYEIKQTSRLDTEPGLTYTKIYESHRSLATNIVVRTLNTMTLTIIAGYRADYLIDTLQNLSTVYEKASPFLKKTLKLCINCDPYPDVIKAAREVTWIPTDVVVNGDFDTVYNNTYPGINHAFDVMNSSYNLNLPYSAKFHPRVLELFEYFYLTLKNQIDAFFAFQFYTYVKDIYRYETNKIAHQLLIGRGQGFDMHGGWAMSHSTWNKHRNTWRAEGGFDQLVKSQNLRSIYVQHPYVYPYGVFGDGTDSYWEISRPGYFAGDYDLFTNLKTFVINTRPVHVIGIICFDLSLNDMEIFASYPEVPCIVVLKRNSVVPNETILASMSTNHRFIGYVSDQLETSVADQIAWWKSSAIPVSISGILIDKTANTIIDTSEFELSVAPNDVSNATIQYRTYEHLISKTWYQQYNTIMQSRSRSRDGKAVFISKVEEGALFDASSNVFNAYKAGIGWLSIPKELYTSYLHDLFQECKAFIEYKSQALTTHIFPPTFV